LPTFFFGRIVAKQVIKEPRRNFVQEDDSSEKSNEQQECMTVTGHAG
jgi:hypothetical protein